MQIKEKIQKTLKQYCDPGILPKKELTQEILREYFDYQDGNLIRNKRSSLAAKRGKVAGTRRLRDGKTVGKVISLGKCPMDLNRAVYLYHHGIIPDYVLPRDGDFENTRIENLEPLTASEWAKRTNRINNLKSSG